MEWEWYKNLNTCKLFFHFILKANWKDGRFEGKDIPRGSFVSSIAVLSQETGLTPRAVRTAIDHLKKTGEVTSKSYNKFTVFTVNNYYLYQDADKQATSKRQTNDKQATTIEEKEEGKQERNKNTMCKAEACTLFENLWERYPVKKGKGKVSLAAKQRLLKVGRDEMIRAIDRYKTELEKDSDWRKPQNGRTFFNSGYVDYLDATYTPDDKPAKRQKNSFNQFQQNDYDFEKLEKDLLANQEGET